MSRRALSLMEVVVAFGLLATVLPLLLNLFPTSLATLRRSGHLQTATSMAIYRLDECSRLNPRPGIDLSETFSLGDQRFQVVREFYSLDAQRLEVTVSVVPLGAKLAPVRLTTRLIRSKS
ncbi:hypothetical protein JST97_06040 [bacterium]|nr:hypothetical protein [bacterium]